MLVVVIAAFLLLDTLEDTLIEGGPFSGTPLAAVLNFIISLTRGTTKTVESWGYAGLFALMLLESSSLPIPSEVVLPFAGYLVSLGLLNLWLTILVSTAAAIIGSVIDYYIGLKGAPLLTKFKSIQTFVYNQGRLDAVERWFTKYGAFVVFLSRLFPGFRTLASFPAGAAKMPLPKFLAYTTAGCLLWNTVLVYIGEYLGANWTQIAGVIRYIVIAMAVTIVFTVALFLLWRRRTRTKKAGKN